MIPLWYYSAMAFTVRTDRELETALDELTSERRESRQEVVRRAVLEMHERSSHRTDVQAATELMIERWGDVLRRLGDA